MCIPIKILLGKSGGSLNKTAACCKEAVMIVSLLKENRALFSILLMLLLVIATTALADSDDALIARASQILGPLPASMPSEENPITPEKVKLGKILFYEQRISVDGTVSCAKCHPIAL